MLPAACVHATTPASTCSASQAETADSAVDTLDSWQAVAAYRAKFAQCDDGSIAEGSSEAVARLLVDHWDTLPELSRLMAKTPSLRPFVLRHINTTLDTRDLDKIRQDASQCPNGLDSLCKDIGEAAIHASRSP
ncbi:hypothetical protein ISS99_16225 [Dyella mobilis]|uniref:Uncharacterized protein n=1 Tax=Dyella mobilis TaxID=1849582 RepID=A0ABS2KIR0_9GAMM|nr:hypothetical protein [Dyella mobilis]